MRIKRPSKSLHFNVSLFSISISHIWYDHVVQHVQYLAQRRGAESAKYWHHNLAPTRLVHTDVSSGVGDQTVCTHVSTRRVIRKLGEFLTLSRIDKASFLVLASKRNF